MTRATLQAVLAALLFGASAPLAKILLTDAPPVLMASLLYLGCGAAAFLAGLGRARREAALTRADLPALLGALFSGGVAAPILLMVGLANTPAATASLMLNFESVATTLIAALVFKEAIGKRLWLALALITLGSILLSWNASGDWGISWASALVLAACILWGVDNNFTRQISAKDPLAIVTVKGLGAGSFSLLLGLGLGEKLPGIPVIVGALAVGAVCYGASIALFVLALRGLGAARAGTLFATAPFLGALLSLLVFRETPAFSFYLAAPLMVLGVVALLSEEHAHLHAHAPVTHEHTHSHDEHHPHEHAGGTDETHAHAHHHEPQPHSHEHAPDVHHRHEHQDEPRGDG